MLNIFNIRSQWIIGPALFKINDNQSLNVHYQIYNKVSGKSKLIRFRSLSKETAVEILGSFILC